MAPDGGGSPGRGSPASGARGSGPWPASALDRSQARHHPPGLQSVDRQPVRPRLGWRPPPANRYPRSHPNRPEPGSRSRRRLRRSTARRCSRLAPGCTAGAGAAPRFAFPQGSNCSSQVCRSSALLKSSRARASSSNCGRLRASIRELVGTSSDPQRRSSWRRARALASRRRPYSRPSSRPSSLPSSRPSCLPSCRMS